MDGLAVRVVNGDHSAQMTLVLRRTMGKNVTLGSVSTLNGAAGAHFKALRGSLLRFHLRHLTDFLLLLDDHRCFRTPRKTSRPDLTCYMPSPILPCRSGQNSAARDSKKNDSASKLRMILLFAFRRKYHNHLAAFKFRELFYLSNFCQIFANACEHILA